MREYMKKISLIVICLVTFSMLVNIIPAEAAVKWKFSTSGATNVFEVYKDTLCSFGTKINCVCGVFRNTDKCLEHKIELFDIGELLAAAKGTYNSLFFDELSHLLK